MPSHFDLSLKYEILINRALSNRDPQCSGHVSMCCNKGSNGGERTLVFTKELLYCKVNLLNKNKNNP